MNDPDDKRDFNLFEEMARGALYRGGKDADDFLSGYVWGFLLMLGITIALAVIGTFAG